jgi:hypothetical protein
MDYPSRIDPGRADAVVKDDSAILQNNVLQLSLSCEDRRLKPTGLVNKQRGDRLGRIDSEFFHITTGPDAKTYPCSQLTMRGRCDISKIVARPHSRTVAKRSPGTRVSASLVAPDGIFTVEWWLELRDGSNYIRQFVKISPKDKPVRIASVQFCDVNVKEAYVAGTVPGSPIIAGDCFVAYEHPNAENTVIESRAVCRLNRDTLLKGGQSLTQSAVLGVVPTGQLRRGFLYYIERQRIAPYRPFLHYNSWYDIAWGGREKMNSAECVEVIDSYGSELIKKRGVQVDSLVFDDGWDDPKTLWQILRKNFPDGFNPLQRSAEKYGTKIGLWLSPWGGYGKAKADRLAYGKTQGFETGKAGFSLAGPKYFARFRQSCVGFVEQYGVNFFKFDGTDATLLAETEALLGLSRELHSLHDEMFISLTTGTWASPFWLLHADSVWRGGRDMGFFGPGSKREQWLTYRDKITYQNMVKAGPLYPLNSFMNQGIANAVWGTANLPADPEQFAHEVHSFFGIGTSLQELYIAPSRMTAQMWDVLAEGAKWSRENSHVLVDTHWIGGDPDKLQIYGCASWHNDKAILMLRNPADKTQTITLDIAEAFELPSHAKAKYILGSPWKKDRHNPALTVEAARPHVFKLAPFEVVVLESQ